MFDKQRRKYHNNTIETLTRASEIRTGFLTPFL